MSKARSLASNVTYLTNITTDVIDDNDIGTTVQAYDSNLTSFVDTFNLPTSDGTVGQALITDGSGTVAFGDVAGGGGSFEAVASGALANGDMVVINSNGTVSAVSYSGELEGSGSPVVFESAYTQWFSAAFDSNSNKVVIAYRGGNAGTAVVGTVSGTSISFGTPVAFDSSGTMLSTKVVFDSNSNKVVIAYKDNTNAKGYVIVGTVSGTSISFGTKVLFKDSGIVLDSAAFDSNSNKVVIAYQDNLDSYKPYMIVGTVSGDTITFGTPVTWNTIRKTDQTLVFDSSNNKFVIAYSDTGNSYYGKASVVTVSGTSVSVGSAVTFNSNTTTNMAATFDSNSNKVVIAYRDNNTSYGTVRVGTVSGTSISFGSPVVFNSASIYFPSATFDSANNKVVIAYSDGNGNSYYGTVVVGTVSGTSINFDTPVVFESAQISQPAATFDSSSNKAVIAYVDSGNSSYGTAVVYQTVDIPGATLTAENFVGISDDAYANGAAATIQVAGSVDDAQSGLTAGQAYYVQTDGTLSTTPDDPRVFAGTAISATELLIGGMDSTIIDSLATETYVDTAVANLVDSAPGALDTLNELAAALGDDANFATTVTNSLAAKADTSSLATVATSGDYTDLSNTPTIPSDVSDLTDTTNIIPSDVSDLTDTTSLLGGSGGSSFEAVASGALENGDMVVINSDGTVSVVGEELLFSAGAGSEVTYSSDARYIIGAVFDSTNNKVVIATRRIGSPTTGYAIVGTVSGDTITFGSETAFSSSTSLGSTAVTYDPDNNKLIIAYNDNSNSGYGTAVVGTVSGDTITFGTPVVFLSARCTWVSAVFDSINDKVVIAYAYYGTTYSSHGYGIVGTISGNTISFGSPTIFNSALTEKIETIYDSANGKVVISYGEFITSGSYYAGEVVVGTVSGTSISFGSPVVFGRGEYTSLAFDSTNNKVILASSSGSTGYGMVCTVSGTSISFGSGAVFTTSNLTDLASTYDSANNKVVITYRDASNSNYGTAVVGTVSGTSISFGSPDVFNTGGTYSEVTFDSYNNKVVIAYRDESNSNLATAVVYQSVDILGGTNLTAENFVGISDGAYADGATATIQTQGSVDDAQSGLTAGQSYYVQADNTLSTTPDDPHVFAGTAISATELLIGGMDHDSLAAKADASSLATVATSGDYTDLSNTPTIPSDVSDLTDTTSLLGGGGPSFDAVASGALENGDMVVINSDGTVSVVADGGSTEASGGDPVVVDSSNSDGFGLAFDPVNNRVVLAYRGGGGSYAHVVVGTVSGTSISFGTPVVLENTNSGPFSAVFDPVNNKVVIGYYSVTNSGPVGIVGTVSGTSISFGTAVKFDTGWSSPSAVFDSTNNKVVFAYRDTGNLSYGTAVVGTVSGTSISFGTPVVFNAGNTRYTSTTYDSFNNKVVITYADYGNSNYGTAVVGTVSGTTISFGTETVFSSQSTTSTSAVFDQNSNKVLISYTNLANSYYGTAVVGTVSGTSISFGTPVVFNSGYSEYISGVSYENYVILTYTVGGVITALQCTVDGTNISFGDGFTLASPGQETISVLDSTNNKVVIAYRDSSNSYRATAVVYQPLFQDRNLTAKNFVGISDGAYADGATATIQIVGAIDDAQSGLTAGEVYYVQTDGTLSTTPGSPSVFAGTAISATKLIIKG